MSFETPDQPRRPLWTPVGDGEPKPAPASAAMTPEPIDADDSDADIIRPVASTPSEELFPTDGAFSPEAVSPYASGEIDTRNGSDEPERLTDPVRELGQSAVTNASFSAGGAHTPMGGVPLPRGTFIPADAMSSQVEAAPARRSPFAPVTPASADTEFVPTYEAREPADSVIPPTVSFATLAPSSGDVPVEPAPPHHANRAHGIGTHEAAPWWRSAGALVAYGLIVMAGLGYGVFTLAFIPEPVTLAAEVLVEGPPDNGIAPIELVEPTPFLAGAPIKTPTHTLTEVQSYGLGELDDLPGRTAEVHDLTYFDGVTTYQVRAYQHFNTDDAVGTFNVLTADGPPLTPVEAAGEQVGERAEVDTEDGTALVWRNTTAVFVMNGPEDGMLEFFTLFGW